MDLVEMTNQKPIHTESQLKEERVLDSGELFRGSRAVVINHQGTQYRLILTKQGKLVLNK